MLNQEPIIQQSTQFFRNYEDPKIVPWAKKKTLQIQNSMIRLHNEIIDFYNFITPIDEEHKLRSQAVERLKLLIQQTLPNAELVTFGSFATKLYLPNGDIDCVLILEEKTDISLRNKMQKILIENQDLYSNVVVIKSAKVPIIKFIETKTQFNFDISFNKLDGIYQLKEVEKSFEQYPEMKYLFMIFKIILRQRDLNETYSGGVGSFLGFCMVLAFLRDQRKQFLYENKIDQIQNMLLSEHLLRFLEYYGQKFDLRNNTIIMINGGSIQQKQSYDSYLSLISPQDQNHDIGNAAFKMNDIVAVFRNRFQFLTSYNFQDKESILKYLLNPCKEEFMFRR